MKIVFLIFVFFSSSLLAQVGPVGPSAGSSRPSTSSKVPVDLPYKPGGEASEVVKPKKKKVVVRKKKKKIVVPFIASKTPDATGAGDPEISY